MHELMEAGEKLRSTGRRSMAGPRRISIICGSLVRYDAISECALACLEAVALSGGNGMTIEVRLYCLESNIGDSRIHVVDSLQTLVAEPFFQASDIIIHHFGIISDLHGALAVAPRSAYVVIQFYGVTPPQFLPKTLEGVISDSFIQIGLFEYADEIITNSRYLENELRRIGLDTPIRRIDLFGVNIGHTPNQVQHNTSLDQLNVVYCGRFVESKQILALLESLDTLTADFPSLQLTLVGLANYSDGGYFAEVRSRAAAINLKVVFELNRTTEQVIEAVSAADILVLPSLHEGFGMPVAEALAALTPVVCSDAGSLPEVAGSLALLFKSADTNALTTALHAALTARAAGEVLTESGRYPYAVWAAEARSFSDKYRREAFVERWKSATVEMLTRIKLRRLSDTAHNDVVRRVFPDRRSHDPGEAQLIGRFVTLKTIGRIDVDWAGAIDVLHRWAFGRAAEDQDRIFWSGELEQCGNIGEMFEIFADIPQVRASALRSRSLVGSNAILIEGDLLNKTSTTSRQKLKLPRMTRDEIEYVLKRSRTPLDFVKAAYVMILGREYDPKGLESHIHSAANRDNWDSIIESFYSSDEYRGSAKYSEN